MTPSTQPDPLLVFDHAVVGASDPTATVAFLQAFGLEELAPDTTAGTFLGVPGAEGAIRVRPADVPGQAAGPYATGGQALDLYTSDMARSLDVVDRLGLRRGPAVAYAFGPLRLGQVLVHGPDDLVVVLVEVDHRLPSALDAAPGRLHSQLHSVVWGVHDLGAATAFFSGPGGLALRASFPLAAPEVSTFMELPRPSSMHMSVLSHPDARAPRFELLSFDAGSEGPGEGGHRAGHPLAAGRFLPAFTTGDLVAVEALVGGHRRTDVLGESLLATAPGGVDLEVRPHDPNVGPFYARLP